MTVKMLYNVGVDYIAVIMVRQLKQVLKLKKKCAPLRRKKTPNFK